MTNGTSRKRAQCCATNVDRIAAIVRDRFGFDEDVEQYVIELAGSVARAAPLGGGGSSARARDTHTRISYVLPIILKKKK